MWAVVTLVLCAVAGSALAAHNMQSCAELVNLQRVATGVPMAAIPGVDVYVNNMDDFDVFTVSPDTSVTELTADIEVSAELASLLIDVRVFGWNPAPFTGRQVLNVTFLGQLVQQTTGTTGTTGQQTTGTTGVNCPVPYQPGCPCSANRECPNTTNVCFGSPGLCYVLGGTTGTTGAPVSTNSGPQTGVITTTGFADVVSSAKALAPGAGATLASVAAALALARPSPQTAAMVGAAGALTYGVTQADAQGNRCVRAKITIRVPQAKPVCVLPAGGSSGATTGCVAPTTSSGSGSGSGTSSGSGSGSGSSGSGSTTTTGCPSCTFTITNVSDTQFCAQGSGVITLAGTGFDQGVDIYAVSSTGVEAPLYMYFPKVYSSALISAAFPESGTYSLEMRSQFDGSTLFTWSGSITVNEGIGVYFTDPPTVYNGVNFVLTIFATGVTSYVAPVDGVVVSLNGGSTSYSYSGGSTVTQASTTQAFQDPTNFGRIQVVIPSGAPVGTYTATVLTGSGCGSQAFVNDLFTVTGTADLNLLRVDPPFVKSGANTGVVIYGDGTPPFQDVPRVFLNGVGRSIILSGVTFINSEALQAIIPASAVAGQYEVIVVNPDGKVGRLATGVEVLATDPPEVKEIVPGYLASNSNDNIQEIYGTGFVGPVSQMKLTCECVDWLDPPGTPSVIYPQAGTLRPQALNTCGGSVECPPVAQTGITQRLTVNLPGGEIGAGQICVIRVTNSNDAYFDFSAVVTRAPSAKLDQWKQVIGADLQEARRGHESDVVPVTTSSKYIYAIGGDSGVLTGAKTTCETSQLDKFGNVQPFFKMRYELPAPRTFGYLNVVGKFLYYTGGHTGSGVTDTVLRAEVLDPLKTTPLEVVLKLEEGNSQVQLGVFYYAVSATFAPNDENNPGGESLPGEYLTIYFPESLASGVAAEVNLTWGAIPDAVGYRLYRTPVGGLGASDLELLAVLPSSTRSYSDDLSPTIFPAEYPLKVGETGVWHTLRVSMNTPRWGHTSMVTGSYDVVNKFYLTAHSGKSGTAASGADLLTSYEAFGIQVYPQPTGLVREKQQYFRETAAAGWPASQTGNDCLASCKSKYLSTGGNMATKFMTDGSTVKWTDYVGLDQRATLLVLGPGSDEAGGLVSSVEGSYINSGDSPDHTTWQERTYNSFQRYGYCMLQAFGLVHMVGGVKGSTNFRDITSGTGWNSYAVGLSTSSGNDPQALCRDLTQMFGCGPFNSEAGGTMQQSFAGCAEGNGLFFMHGGVYPGTFPNALKTVWRATQ